MTRAILMLFILASPALAAPILRPGKAEESAARLIEDAGGTAFRAFEGGPVTWVKAGPRPFGATEVNALAACSRLEWLDLRAARFDGTLDLTLLRHLRGVSVPARCLARKDLLTLGPSVRALQLEGEADPLPGLKALAKSVEELALDGMGELKMELMELLPAMPRLHTLRMGHSTHIPDGAVKHLAKLTRLRQLALPLMLDDPTPALIAMKGLERLTIDQPENLRFLGKLPALKALWLMDPTTDDDALAPLAGLANLEDLMLLRATKVTDKGLAHLAGLKKLRDLDLTGTPIRGGGLQHVAKAPLRSLTLFGGPTDDALVHAATMTGLEELSLSEARISGKALAGLRTLTRLRTLHVHIMPDAAVQTPGDAAFACLRAMKGLEDLSISDAKLGEAAFGHIGTCTKLRKLELGRCGLTGEGLKHLSGCGQLLELTFRSQPLEDRHLASLSHLQGLRTLWLFDCPITGEGLPAMRGLRRLELRSTKADDTGLARIGKLEGLTHLGVTYSPVTSDGLKHLAKLAGLRELVLEKTKVGDAGLDHIETLRKLRVLNLNQTLVTDNGLRQLARMTHLHEVSVVGIKATPAGPKVRRPKNKD